MARIRRYFPEIDKAECQECGDRAEIVIEEYPTAQQSRTLCRDCATAALQAHPDLLASLVSTLMRNSRPVVASIVRAL